MQVEKVFFERVDGLKLCGILEEPNQDKEEIVIFVHGHSSSKDSPTIKEVSDEVLNRNINAFRIDLNGCGESEGKFEDQTMSNCIDDLDAAIEFVKERGYSKIGLMGSSAGGLTVMATALKHPEINRIALKAPVSDYPAQRLEKYGQEYLDDWKEKGYNIYIGSGNKEYKIPYSWFEDTKKHVMFGKVRDIKCPVLILHGDQDESVPLEHSQRIIKEFCNGKLLILKGADHKLVINGDRSKSIKMIADWFEKGEIPD